LKRQRAIVTGSTSGIGLIVVRLDGPWLAQ